MKVLMIGDSAEIAATLALIRRSAEPVSAVFSWSGRQADVHGCRPLGLTDGATISEVVRATVLHKIDLVLLASPWAVLKGYANAFQSQKIPCFGPTRVASHLILDRESVGQLFRRLNASGILRGRKILLESAGSSAGHDFTGYTRTGWYRFTAIVCGKKIIPCVADDHGQSVSELIAAPLFSAAEQEDHGYCGWFYMELYKTRDAVRIRALSCTPGSETLHGLSETAGFDFLRVLRHLKISTKVGENDQSLRRISAVPVRI